MKFRQQKQKQSKQSEAIKKAAKEHNRNLQNCQKLRRIFLEKPAEAWAEANEQLAVKRLKFLILMEERRKSFAKIKHVRDQLSNKSGLSTVIITENNAE